MITHGKRTTTRIKGQKVKLLINFYFTVEGRGLRK